MALDPSLDEIVTSNPMLVRLFRALPIAPACDLHQRLQAGRNDSETRTLLRKALVLSHRSRDESQPEPSPARRGFPERVR